MNNMIYELPQISAILQTYYHIKLKCNGDKRKRIIKRTCTKIITGMPILNFRCFVLCLNVYMPMNIPILPPIKENAKRVASGMRKAFLRALRLSFPIKANPIMFTVMI